MKKLILSAIIALPILFLTVSCEDDDTDVELTEIVDETAGEEKVETPTEIPAEEMEIEETTEEGAETPVETPVEEMEVEETIVDPEIEVVTVECEEFQIETENLGRRGYSFEVTTPDVGEYEWYVAGEKAEQEADGVETNFSSFFINSVPANADYEICAKRIDIDADCEACAIVNAGCPEIDFVSFTNLLDSVSDDTETITFSAFEVDASVQYGYTWTVDDIAAPSVIGDVSTMKYTFSENGMYEVCAKLFSFRCEEQIICETVMINSL